MPNSMSVYHFLQVDFGEGYLLSYLVTCCDGGKTKSTPSPRPKTGVRQLQSPEQSCRDTSAMVFIKVTLYIKMTSKVETALKILGLW